MGTGSETSEGNLMVYAARRIAGWACVKCRAKSVGSSSIGSEGFASIG